MYVTVLIRVIKINEIINIALACKELLFFKTIPPNNTNYTTNSNYYIIYVNFTTLIDISKQFNNGIVGDPPIAILL